MTLHRRQFLAGIAATPMLVGVSGLWKPARGESLALNWPSMVLQTPVLKAEDKPPVITSVAIHPQGRLVAMAGDDHMVYLWNLADGKILHKLEAHNDWVHTLAFSPEGNVLASAGTDRRVIFWDLNSAEKVSVIESNDHPITKIAWSHRGDFIAATGFEDDLHLYDSRTHTLLRELKCPCRDMRVVDFSPDDALLAAGGRDGVVRLWNAGDGQHLMDYRAHRHRIRGLEFSPDGKLLVTSGEDRQIHVRQMTAQDDGFKMPESPAKVMSLEFYGPHHLATGCSDNIIRLWDVVARAETGKLRGHTGSVTALARYGHLLVSGSYDATTRVWTISDNVADDAVRTLSPVRTSRKPE